MKLSQRPDSSNQELARLRNKGWHSRLLLLLAVLLASGCGTVQVQLQSDFPVPIVEPLPVSVGVLVPDELLGFTHSEEIPGLGDYAIGLGQVPADLLQRLGTGVFRQHQLQQAVTADDAVDGYLLTNIEEVQLALPKQTRSDYYEVWIRFRFEFLDQTGASVSQWVLSSYGKANEGDYRGAEGALQAAALLACRDAMAFFSLNLASHPSAQQWLANMATTHAAADTAEASKGNGQ